MIRVAIADDHYLVREGTGRILEASGEVEVVASVEDGIQLRDAVDRLEPDAVVVDIRMPPTHQMEGIEAAHDIRAKHQGVGVVVLSQHANSLYAFELFKDGTEGLAYLLKDRVGDLDELLRALREVVTGGSVIDPLVVEGLLNRQRTSRDRLLDTLTPRELDVLAAMAEGRSNASIRRRSSSHNRRSRSTSTRSSRSSRSRPTSRTPIAGWRPFSRSSVVTRPADPRRTPPVARFPPFDHRKDEGHGRWRFSPTTAAGWGLSRGDGQ